MHKLAFPAVLVLLSATPAFAATYQVTGTIIEINPKIIVIEKDNERWAMTRDPKTKVGNVQKGSRATIKYSMTAQEVINRGNPPPNAQPPGKPPGANNPNQQRPGNKPAPATKPSAQKPPAGVKPPAAKPAPAR